MSPTPEIDPRSSSCDRPVSPSSLSCCGCSGGAAPPRLPLPPLPPTQKTAACCLTRRACAGSGGGSSRATRWPRDPAPATPGRAPSDEIFVTRTLATGSGTPVKPAKHTTDGWTIKQAVTAAHRLQHHGRLPVLARGALIVMTMAAAPPPGAHTTNCHPSPGPHTATHLAGIAASSASAPPPVTPPGGRRRRLLGAAPGRAGGWDLTEPHLCQQLVQLQLHRRRRRRLRRPSPRSPSVCRCPRRLAVAASTCLGQGAATQNRGERRDLQPVPRPWQPPSSSVLLRPCPRQTGRRR